MNAQSLGEFLRQEREKRGMTVEQISAATKISTKILHSIESDQYAELPALPFVKGFVHSYCRCIGLDSEVVFNQYEKFLLDSAKERPSREEGHKGYAFEKRDHERSRRLVTIALVSIIALGAVGGLVRYALKNRRNRVIEVLKTEPKVKEVALEKPSLEEELEEPLEVDTKKENHPKVAVAKKKEQRVEEPPLAEKKESEEKESQEEEDKNPDPLNKGNGLRPGEYQHKIVFKALANTWVRYKVDDKPLTRFMLQKGAIIVFKGKTAIRFQTSNPKSMMVKYHSASYEPLEEWKQLQTRKGNPTVFLPKSAEDGAFASLDPLPLTPNPQEESVSSE